ncbi:MAG: CTP synthase, partial [Nitrospinota bacterium]
YEALIHGGIPNKCKVHLQWIDAETLEKSGDRSLLDEVDGILIPGGFGTRGIEGKIVAVQHSREKQIPFFGICLGMHCAIIEFARNVCKTVKANTSEVDEKTPHPVIDFLPNQNNDIDKGGTMRLGAWKCQVRKHSNAFKAYGTREISERHRHRYEFNNKYRLQMEEAGMIFSGLSPDGNLVEIVEIADHPWFLAGQFHPEFKSTPRDPHPLFEAFLKASLEHKTKKVVSD